jgi:hypothetical protein
MGTLVWVWGLGVWYPGEEGRKGWGILPAGNLKLWCSGTGTVYSEDSSGYGWKVTTCQLQFVCTAWTALAEGEGLCFPGVSIALGPGPILLPVLRDRGILAGKQERSYGKTKGSGEPTEGGPCVACH